MFEELVAAVRGLAESVEVAGLDGDGCVALAVAAQRGVNVLEALKLRAVAEFAQHRQLDSAEPVVPGRATPRWGRISEFAPTEIAVPLGLTRRSGDLLMSLAYSLDQRLPATAVALRRGEIDVRRAQTLADETASLPEEVAREVEAAVLPRAGGQTPARLRRAIRRAVLQLAPNVVEEQERQTQADRGAWLDHRGDGSSELDVRGPTHDLLRLATAINHVGYTLPKDPDASPEQRRFDALQLMANAILDDPSLPNGRFGRPGLVLLTELGEEARTAAEQHENAQATNDATTLAEDADVEEPEVSEPNEPPAESLRDEAPGDAPAASDPGSAGDRDGQSDLDGHSDQRSGSPPSGTPPHRLRRPRRLAELLDDGPLSEAAAQLAAHRHTRLVGYDPAVVETCDHTRGYPIPDPLARHVAGYWRYCAFPSCSVPAHRCDTDHVRAWPDGPTCGCNLTPLCRYHHRLKTHTTWRVRLLPGYVAEWTSPTGRVTHVYPADDEPGRRRWLWASNVTAASAARLTSRRPAPRAAGGSRISGRPVSRLSSAR